MFDTSEVVLDILDEGARAFIFPMLDNGYVYPAASRLKLFRSETHWAIVFELFGFSPRSGVPHLAITTFTDRPVRTRSASDWVSASAHRDYLAAHPHDEQIFVEPIEDDGWIDPEDGEWLATEVRTCRLRGRTIALPSPHVYRDAGIVLQSAGRPQVYEFCRALASIERDAVLATDGESRQAIEEDLELLLTLEEWHHADVADSAALPSRNETMRQLAAVVTSGDVSLYRPTVSANTHWSNWPDGGTL